MRYWKFVCKKDTEAECFQRMLFGDVYKNWEKVEKVQEGDICFLYNLDTDTLFGPFEARSKGQLNIEPEAWGGRFPAQVKVDCKTITVFANASNEFDFLKDVTLVLTEEQGRRILEKIEIIKPTIPSNIKEEIQRLDEEIHKLAHRIEEVKLSIDMHPADKEVEIDKLKGQFYSKMKDFVWKIRLLDKQTRILDLPSNQ
jgi:hypothetical protein